MKFRITTALCAVLSVFALCGHSFAGPVHIYFTDGGPGGPVPDGTGTVKRVNGDGTGLMTLVSGLYRPRGITMNPGTGQLFWNDWGPGSTTGVTQRSNLDGSGVTTIVAHGQSGINDIAVNTSTGRLFVSMSVSFSPFHGVRSFNLNGSGAATVVNTWPPGSESPAGVPTGWFLDGVAVDPVNGHMYYADPGVLVPNGGPSGVVRTNLDGTGAVSLVPHLNGRGRGIALDLDGGKMFFAEHPQAGSGIGRIWSADLDGSDLMVIVSGLARPRDVAWDPFDKKLYWVDETLGVLQRSNADGSNIETIVSGLDAPDSLVLEFAEIPEPASLTVAGMIGLGLAGFCYRRRRATRLRN